MWQHSLGLLSKMSGWQLSRLGSAFPVWSSNFCTWMAGMLAAITVPSVPAGRDSHGRLLLHFSKRWKPDCTLRQQARRHMPHVGSIARDWLHWLLQCKAQSPLSPDTISFNAALNACDKSGQWVLAIDLLRRMQQDVVRADAGVLAAMLAFAICRARANIVLNAVADVFRPKAITYTCVLGACEHSCRWELMHCLLHTVIDGGFDEWTRTDIDYVHYYQAGAPADCLKHLILCALLEHVVQDAESFLYIDTHAGSGLYDLRSEEAMRFENYRHGIDILASWEHTTALRTMHGFFSTLRKTNLALGEESLRYYPGSPAIAQSFLRPQDSALLFEASREVSKVLRDSLFQLREDVAASVLCANSYEWFANFAGGQEVLPVLPSSPSRVAALVDPPYDSASSSDKWNLFLVKHLTIKWPSSCILLWCPYISDLQMSLRLLTRYHVQEGHVARMLLCHKLPTYSRTQDSLSASSHQLTSGRDIGSRNQSAH